MYLYIIIFLFYLLLHSHSFVNYYGTVSGNGTCGPLIHLLVGLILHFMLTFLWLTTLCRELWDITEKDMDLDHRELRDSCELRFVFVQQTNLECIIVWLGLSKCTICSFFCCFVLGFFFLSSSAVSMGHQPQTEDVSLWGNTIFWHTDNYR